MNIIIFISVALSAASIIVSCLAIAKDRATSKINSDNLRRIERLADSTDL